MSLRNSILRSRLHIRNHQKCQGVWISNEDLDDCTHQHRADIRALVILANETGHSARQSTDDIFVDGRKYSKGTLHQLPHDLTMERAMLKTTNKGLAFCSQHTCFSNFHQAPVKYNGIVYTSAEQAFQVTKARRGALHELADQMTTQINPLTIKRLGKKATPPPNWQNERDMIMHDIVKAKFTQNEESIQKLLVTKAALFIEATSDTYWGAGATLNSKENISVPTSTALY